MRPAWAAVAPGPLDAAAASPAPPESDAWASLEWPCRPAVPPWQPQQHARAHRPYRDAPRPRVAHRPADGAGVRRYRPVRDELERGRSPPHRAVARAEAPPRDEGQPPPHRRAPVPAQFRARSAPLRRRVPPPAPPPLPPQPRRRRPCAGDVGCRLRQPRLELARVRLARVQQSRAGDAAPPPAFPGGLASPAPSALAGALPDHPTAD